jgi:hypothetical protein
VPTPGAAYTLRARVRARRGKEASGHIYVLPAPTVSTRSHRVHT